EEVRSSLRKSVLARKLFPVLAGAAFKNKGIQPLLDAVINFLPSPIDRGTVRAKEVHGEKELDYVDCPVSFDQPSLALAFKLMTDTYVGSLVFVRVYAGTIKIGDQLLNPRTQKKERVQKIFKMHANSRQEIPLVKAGDIAAVFGPKNTGTGDTLCSPQRALVLESIHLPEPVISVVIEPKTSADQAKLETALATLVKEDPSARLKIDPETGQMLLSGMGELHLEILVDRLYREFHLMINVGRPQVSYRESVAETVTGEFEFDRLLGGTAHYAKVCLELIPVEKHVTAEERIIWDQQVTQQLFLSVEAKKMIAQGCLEALDSGFLAGFPVIGVNIRVLNLQKQDGKEFSEAALRGAAALAVRDALKKAHLNLLEPIFKLEIRVPDSQVVGAVVSDLTARRGKVEAMNMQDNGTTVITALVPLANLFGYSTDVRSLSQGRAQFSMEFAHYEVVPGKVRDDVLRSLGRL
ncbi:MAG: EF-Tu/IF-2/RF-3 family GTPase, partial [Bdellovibrionaceae bacterium]|nr:EF-Tu/IF-2/RF-3 family GTPase [Pseudobdellovibrionaceae bacterium]